MDRNGITRRGLLVGAAAAGALTAPLLRAKPAGASEGGDPMSDPAQAAQASPLAAIFERNHVGWETKDPDRIASLAAEDTIFWLHDGSEPVKGRSALRRHCAELFASFDFSHVVDRILYGENHWTLEWTMVLSLAEPDGSPFTARVEMLDVVMVDALGEVARKDVWMNGAQSRAAFARAGIERR
ncbi:MAG TPA: nuclear transport factor 2 family protein [Myxococcota bacterium]|nr:nuclear transport factor 2 family protein [Myxococcota bacterium]